MKSGKYKLGYYNFVYCDNGFLQWKQLKLCSQMCERFVVGIPNEEMAARIMGSGKGYSAEEIRDFIKDIKWVDKVLLLDGEHLSRQKIYEEMQFDVCFYGSEYGRVFEQDRVFMRDHQVDFLPLIPERFNEAPKQDALMIALENVRKEQKIILFGTGAYFDLYMKYYGHRKGSHPGKSYLPAYAVDNASEKWGTYKDGVLIQSPETLRQEDPENVLVILCSRSYQEMLEQLKKLGDFDYRTLLVNQSIALLDEFYIAYREEQEYLKRCREIIMLLMQEMNRVCRKYGLHYYMTFGSLIGAVREHDIIPWDDDLDVIMTREDFDKLKQVAHEEWSGEAFEFIDYDEFGNGIFFDCISRVIYKKERLPIKIFDKVAGKAKVDVDNRMGMEIYTLDHASDDNKKHMRTMYLMKAVYALCMGHRGMIDYSEYEDKKSAPFMFALRAAHAVGKMIPLKWLVAWYEHLRRYAKKVQGEDYFIANSSITCIERRIKKKFYGEGKWVPFGEIEVMIPDDPDSVLKAMNYRNYMTPLPEHLRKPSHYFNSDITIW